MDTGFNTTASDQLVYNAWLAGQVTGKHTRVGVSVWRDVEAIVRFL